MKTDISVSSFWVSLEAGQGIRCFLGFMSTACLPTFKGQLLMIHLGSCESREQQTPKQCLSSLWFPMELPPTGQNCSSSKLPLSVRQGIVNRMFRWFFFFFPPDSQPQYSVRKKYSVNFLIHSSFDPEKKTIIWCFSLEIKKKNLWFTKMSFLNFFPACSVP